MPAPTSKSPWRSRPPRGRDLTSPRSGLSPRTPGPCISGTWGSRMNEPAHQPCRLSYPSPNKLAPSTTRRDPAVPGFRGGHLGPRPERKLGAASFVGPQSSRGVPSRPMAYDDRVEGRSPLQLPEPVGALRSLQLRPRTQVATGNVAATVASMTSTTSPAAPSQPWRRLDIDMGRTVDTRRIGVLGK